MALPSNGRQCAEYHQHVGLSKEQWCLCHSCFSAVQLQLPVHLGFWLKESAWYVQWRKCILHTAPLQHVSFRDWGKPEPSLLRLSYSFCSTTCSGPHPIWYAHLYIHSSATMAYPLQQELVSPISLAQCTPIIHLSVLCFSYQLSWTMAKIECISRQVSWKTLVLSGPSLMQQLRNVPKCPLEMSPWTSEPCPKCTIHVMKVRQRLQMSSSSDKPWRHKVCRSWLSSVFRVMGKKCCDLFSILFWFNATGAVH